MGFDWQAFYARAGKATLSLVVLSVLVSLATWWGQNDLTFYVLFQPNLIAEGQIHRLISPIFLHFMIAGLPIHLLFNMMWLWDMGGNIEKARSAKYLLILVVIIGVLSNGLAYLGRAIEYGQAVDMVRAGGMSGVIYGLLGFLVVRPKLDRFFPVRINPAILQLLLIWLVLGFIGLIGNVDNIAHLSGLAIGALLGFITAKVRRFA